MRASVFFLIIWSFCSLCEAQSTASLIKGTWKEESRVDSITVMTLKFTGRKRYERSWIDDMDSSFTGSISGTYKFLNDSVLLINEEERIFHPSVVGYNWGPGSHNFYIKSLNPSELIMSWAEPDSTLFWDVYHKEQ